jgi:hypothetical protein
VTVLTFDFETASGVARERFAHLPLRVVNILVRKGQRSWEQIAATSDEDLLTLTFLGPTALDQIRTEQRRQRR